MSKYKLIGRILIVLSLLLVNFFPILGVPFAAESGAPDVSGVTTVTWYVNATDDVSYNNDEFWTRDIQINSSGKMVWDNIAAYIDGNITVQSNGFFNLTNSLLNLSGNFSVEGTVNFDNVTLIMNSSYDNEHWLSVTQTGTFNVLNNSNITAYDKTTPIDLDTTIAGNESWGLHYNFTVYGNITINNSYISYIYGNTIGYPGGIHLYETALAKITNSTIFENQISAIYAERNGLANTTHIIKNNHIYNATAFGIVLLEHANAIIQDNTIETYDDNYGYGIVCFDHSSPVISRNTIQNNRYDGIYLIAFSNATITNNTIIDNRVGVHFRSEVLSITPSVITTSCFPKIIGNDIINNYEFGIYDYCCPAEIVNNTISQTQNRSGIFVHNFIRVSLGWVGFDCRGNITNNVITYNNQYGINLSSDIFTSPYIVRMTVNNNTITNNNWSGIQVIGGRASSTQRSPMPTITLNTISNNNHSGVRNYETLNYELSYNYIQNNNESGIICEANSRPVIENNYNISWNKGTGITTMSTSRPRISYNNITYNSDNGISVGSGFNSQINYNIITNNLGHGLASVSANPNINNNQITNNDHSGVYLEGGSGTLSVRANDITYNSWCGIETNGTNGQIRDNNLTNNSQDGIRLFGGSPVIDIDNLVNYNTWDGLACYQNARPLITNSEFQNNGKNGILLDSSSPRISTIAVKNMVKSNTMNGIVCSNGSSGIVMADIMGNTLNGVYATDTGTNTEILNSMISNNGLSGVNSTSNSAPVITNSTIINNVEAFWLDGSADPIALNDTFTDTEVWFEDTASTLTVQWHVFISTQSKQTGAPVGNVKVWVNSTTTSQVAWTGHSDASGRIEWLEITEYVESDSNNNHRATDMGERTSWTPYDVSGDRRGFRLTHVSPNPEINRSMTIVLELLSNQAPSGATNIKPISTHNAHPTISWDPCSDPDGHSISYQVWVGPNINTSTIHESTDLLTTSYSLPVDLEFNADGNKTYYVTIVTTDDHGGQKFMTNPLYLLNSNPTEPEIEIEYSGTPSVELQWVKCKITTESFEPDGDEINYTYKWYKNDKPQSLLSEVETKNLEDTISINIDDIEFKKGDVWRVEVRAEDGLLDPTSLGGKSNWVSIEFPIGNLGPRVASAIEDIVMDEDSESIDAIDLTTKFMDPDQSVGTLDYFATADDENLTVSINAQTHKVSFTPAENWNGKTRVNITCKDDEGLWVTQWFDVTVKPVNDEPVIIKIGTKEVLSSIVEFLDDDAATEEEWFNITIEASDIDIERGEDDEITFNLIDDYEKIQLTHDEPLKATLSFFPTNDEVGSYEFMISIKDKSMKSYKQKIIIKVEVKNSNDKPELLSIKKLPSGKTYPVPANRMLDLSALQVKENEILRLLVTAMDPDIDEELTFHTDSVSIVEVDANTGNPYTAEIIITPDEKSIGDFIFNITVKDRKLEKDTVQIFLEIENVNDKPTVKIISPSAFELEDDFKPYTPILFEGFAEDKDIPYGDKLFYKWTSDKDGDLAYNLSFTISDLTIGEHIIIFEAEDSEGESASTLISVRIGGLDKDGDLLPDNWEKLFFGDVLKYESSDDPDKDGYSNFDEYLSGSNPTDKNDPEKQPEEEESNLIFYASVSIMVIVIIIVLVILLLFMLKTRKRKREAEEEQRPLEIEPQKTKEDLYAELYGDMDEGSEAKPEDEAKPGAPEKLTPTGEGAGTAPGTTPKPGVLPSSVPSQITTCPKCNTPMTFSPSGGLFCIKCGFRPGQ